MMTTTVASMASAMTPAVVDFAVSDWSDLDPHFTQVCSDATLQSDRRGFFLDLVEAVTDGAGIAFVEEFAKLKGDRRRVDTCYSHPKVSIRVRVCKECLRHRLQRFVTRRTFLTWLCVPLSCLTSRPGARRGARHARQRAARVPVQGGRRGVAAPPGG